MSSSYAHDASLSHDAWRNHEDGPGVPPDDRAFRWLWPAYSRRGAGSLGRLETRERSFHLSAPSSSCCSGACCWLPCRRWGWPGAGWPRGEERKNQSKQSRDLKLARKDQVDENGGYPVTITKVAGQIKAALQMAIGVYALGWLAWSFYLSHRFHNCVPPPTHRIQEQFCYLIPPSDVAFRVVADALAAATVVQLAYTLFTPGPDEALDPVMLALATALLLELGQVSKFKWQDGMAIILYAAGLGVLFLVRVFLAPDKGDPPEWWWRRRSRRLGPTRSRLSRNP
jgi:hypothetical protein